ncbi:uncharacterized protein LOC135287876 isoform X2 [Passer domesticus]|uniref:uncharacterized protein LOC135287876 isoform X2 n=1 Tax=Passer domesticus TaxID=48849 RepID=UPI0030FE2C7B
MALKGTAKIFKASATAFAVSMAQKVAEMIYDEFRRRRREKTNKVLESMIIEAFQDLNNKIKALHEDFKKLEESTKHEVQILRAELEKNPENKEMAFVWTLESMLKKNLQQLSQRIQTLEEDVQEWPETTKHELQLCRGYPENREEEIARELVSMLNKKLRQVSQRIQTLEEKIKEWPETTKNELQLCRVYVEKNQGKKEEESSRALQCRMETLLQQLSQRFQTLEQALQLRQAFPYHEFQLFRAYLENNQGIAMQQEEIIHLRVLELARGERTNIWTDSRCAFGIGPAQGAVWNRRLREARGFFRSVSGGEVEWITPGASDNLHANQDQRTACLNPLFRSIEGSQRSMDIRASRTKDLQVLMVTFGVLISIIILARIFILVPYSHQLSP